MPHTILLIEDNRDIRENMAEILELASYKVLTAENGKSGLELVQENLPDLILCDVMMPELDGYGVIRAIENNPKLRGTPFIFITAKSEKDDIRKGMELGADDYLVKPFSGDDLLSAIQARLKKTAAMRDILKRDSREIEDFIADPASHKDFTRLHEQFSSKKFRKKDVLFMEGESANYLYYVSKGKVKTYRSTVQGKELITQIYKEGDFFGYNALLDEGEHDETAMVIEDAEIAQLPKQLFFKILFSSPELSLKFIRHISGNYSETSEQLIRLAYNSARKRVAEALLFIAKKYSDDEPCDGISFSALRDDISSVSGITPESVSRNLTDFKSENLIEIHGGIIRIPDVKKLRNLRD